MSAGEWVFFIIVMIIAGVGFIGGLIECFMSIFGEIKSSNWWPGKDKGRY
jgi:hypothetical protein